MRFGTLIGGLCGVAGVLFLAINSQILFRGAAAWGLNEWDRISYGIVGATVPWIIAICPFLFVLSFKRGWRGIVTISVAVVVWAIFVVYNFVGAMGSIAAVRGQVIAERQGAADSIESLKYQRNRLQDELGWTPKRRPAGAVAAEIETEKLKPFWHATEECTELRGPSHRKFCTHLGVLKGELASARKADDLNAKIAALTAKIDGRQPVASKADPVADILASLSGLDEALLSKRLPIATPIILEIGSMTLLYFSFILLGLNHRHLIRGLTVAEPGKDGSAAIGSASAPSPSPAIPGEANVGTLPVAGRSPPPLRGSPSYQKELAEWFFRECTRPVASGVLAEDAWYEAYSKICRKSQDVPLSLADFRAMASKYVPSMRTVNGRQYYEGVLPLVPKAAPGTERGEGAA